MQEKKRIPLKRLHRLRNARRQAAETDDLTPMMKAIKAVHSVTSTGSTQPEDLERQRAAQELFGRLVTPNLLINTTPITVNNVSAEWVRMNQGHDRRHVVLYCHGGGYTCGQLGYARVLASKLALSTGCDVLSFEYRLAPEAPYPSAIDDALRVWDYLMYMGIGARDVIVAGDSAGGNLAYSSAFHLHAVGLAFILDSLFGGGIANKKVTGGNLAGNGLNTTGVAGIQCSFDQGRVAVVLCGERCALGNHVVLGVVIYHGFAHADITNADLAGHVACNAGEDDLLGTVFGDEHLHGGSGVCLAHTGAAHNDLAAVQHALVVLHAGVSFFGHLLQLGTQLVNFIGHSAHNANDHGIAPFYQTLKRNSITSPSFTTYSLPSVRCRPLALTAA